MILESPCPSWSRPSITSIKCNVHKKTWQALLYLLPPLPILLSLKWVTFVTFSLHHSSCPRLTPETEPHSFSSCVTQLWTWDKWKGGLFLPRFLKWKWHQVVTQSFSLSLVWGRGVLFFNDFILSWCSSCIVFLKRGWGWRREVKTWKTDDVGLLLVGYVFFFKFYFEI